jgi:ribosome-binding protein aMBF1 (putative translation factor)
MPEYEGFSAGREQGQGGRQAIGCAKNLGGAETSENGAVRAPREKRRRMRPFGPSCENGACFAQSAAWTSRVRSVCSFYPMRDRSGRRRKVEVASDDEAQEIFVSAFGEAIRRGRLARGWTQAALAEASQLSANYIARLERGELGPSLYVAHRIAQALGIDIDALVATEEAPPPVARVRRRVG